VSVAVAALDWFAVGTGRRRIEYLAKPLALLAILGLALALDPASGVERTLVVVALACSLLGDVFLLLDDEPWFVFGLGAFLLAHLAYVAAFWWRGVSPGAFLVGLVVVAVALLVLGRRILRAASGGEHSDLVGPVALYMVVISLMLASAIGTAGALAIAGAALFYCSDALIAWTRFVRPLPQGRLAVIVTYHVAQVLLVLSLV
jgi:uncharacterized membrane protein YhhN